MFTYLNFDVEIVRDIDVTSLRWPESGEARDDSGLGCNRQYVDLRGISWAEAKRVFDLEGELIARIESAEDAEAECEAIDEEFYESDESLFGLDIGVASTVAALSAAKCIPFSSCNAAVYGGHHREAYPLAAFFARPQLSDLLLATATEAGIGLENDPTGCLVAYSDDIRKMRSFAAAIMRQRTSFDAVRRRKTAKRPKGPVKKAQYKLPLDESAGPKRDD